MAKKEVIKKSESLELAENILHVVNARLRYLIEKGDITLESLGGPYVESYSNGREQGLCIQCRDGLSISFSEARGSDDIVVYAGRGFGMQGNTPGDAAYRRAKYYRRKRVIEVATLIADMIVLGVSE